MKQIKRPTLRQKKLMSTYGLNPHDWFVERDTTDELVLVHRYTDTKRIIPKGA